MNRVVSGFIDALEENGGSYDPEEDGYTILIEDEVAVEIGYRIQRGECLYSFTSGRSRHTDISPQIIS